MSSRNVVIVLVSLAVLSAVAIAYDRYFHVGDHTSQQNAVVRQENVPEDETSPLERRAPELLPLFPDANDWRRNSANILIPAGRECYFLSKGSPEISPDQKTVSLDACTLVLIGKETPEHTLEDRVKHAIVLESTEKLELTLSEQLSGFIKFDNKGQKLDLNKFETGRMTGEVFLRARLGESDVLLRTRDVVFNSTQIHTNFGVDFFIGPNSGSGRGLTIDLDNSRFSPRTRKSEETRQEFDDPDSPEAQLDKIVDEGNIGSGFSLKEIHLNQIDGCVKFYSDSIEKMTDDKDDAKKEQADKRYKGYYVEARCKKDLYFNSDSNIPGGWCMKFSKDVELVAFQDGDKKNQILCDSLYLYLQDQELNQLAETNDSFRETIERKRVTGALANLEPSALRALGNDETPVVIRDFENNIKLQADTVQYNLFEHTLTLATEDEEKTVRITQEKDRQTLDFSSKVIEVQMNDDNDVEKIEAQPAGVLKVKTQKEDEPPRAFEAKWTKGLQVAPTTERGYLKATSFGPVKFVGEGLGVFVANEADVWCRLGGQDAPPDPSTEPNAPQNAEKKTVPSFAIKSLEDVKPICAEFRENVAFQSPKGTARISDSVKIRLASVVDEESQAQNDGGSNSPFDLDKKNSIDASKFEIEGRVLAVWCRLHYAKGKREPSIEVSKLQLQRDVLFRERTAISGGEKMSLTAEAVTIENPSSDSRTLRLWGVNDSPAKFKTDKLYLEGTDVTIDGASNFFQVKGEGELAFSTNDMKNALNASDAQAPSQSSKRALIDASEKIEVVWSNSLEFDGRKLTFKSLDSQNVVVTQGLQRLSSPEVSLSLKNPLSIFKLDVNDKQNIDVDSIECSGSVDRPVEIQLVKPPKVGEATDRVASVSALLQNLQYQPSTGKFVASGGGEISATVPSKSDAFSKITDAIGKELNSPQTSESKSSAKAWTKLHSKFRGSIVGDVENQEATLEDGLRTVVAAVDDPSAPLDVNVPDSCPEDYAEFESQSAYFKLFQDGKSDEKGREKQTIEIEASQNVTFKQKDVAGVCDALRYDSSKNLVVLSGSPTQKATLYRQPYPGAKREQLGEFSRATFQLDSRKFNVEDLSH